MGILKFLLFLLSIFPIVHFEYACPSSFGGEVLIYYPFILKGQEQGNNCTYINLTWYIDYNILRIALYDPRNCLPRRFMNNSMNISSSLFMTEYFQNYTFYNCLVNSDPEQYSALPIGCLSNSTNATVATCEVSP